MIGIINKLRISKNKEVAIQQINWIHEELNSACECNDIAELKKKLHVLDSRLFFYSLICNQKKAGRDGTKGNFR